MSEYRVNAYALLEGPGVVFDPIPESFSQPFITPRLMIMHSNAGPRKTPGEALVNWMRRSDVVGEAHLVPAMDGTIRQVIPFNRRADCNYKANQFAISFETQDNGAATLEETPWTIEQFNAMAGAIAAIGHYYGIPYQNPAHWQDSGVGYHSQYKEWSSYTGKTCPGRARIYQMDELRRQAAGICAC
jgi:hypothetical protein